MKSVKYIIVSVLILFAFVNISYGQYASIEKEFVVKERKFEKSNLISECFGEDIYILHGFNTYAGNTDLFITFKKYINGNYVTDNSIFNNFLNKRFKFNFSQYQYSDEIIYSNTLGEMISGIPNDEEIYFKCSNLSGALNGSTAYLDIILEDVNNYCVPINNLCSNGYTLNGQNSTNIDNSSIIRFPNVCGYSFSSEACTFSDYLKAKVIGQDLEVYFDNFPQEIFNNIEFDGIVSINLKVKGVNGQISEIRGETLCDECESLDPQTWKLTFPDFANYNEYYFILKIFFEEAYPGVCNNYIELPITNRKSICNPISLLNYKKQGANLDSLKFSFLDPITGINNLEYELQLHHEMTLEEVESVVSTIDHIDFKLLYTENNIPKEKTITKTQAQLNDIENLTITFGTIDFANFTGVLQTTVHKLNNAIEYCDDKNIVFEILPDPELNIPSNNCDPNASNASNLSQVAYSGTIDVGGVFTANKFPLVITKITSGNNTTGLYGGAIVPLPFQNKQVVMELVGAKFNENKQLIAGKVEGVKGTFNLNLNNLPLQIGGDICLPPPPPAGYTANGVYIVSGLNKYGFNPTTGLYWNGSQYDPGGFDINGNHKDTGLPYNNEGCTRDGVHHQTGEKCDPYGGTPEELPVFVDSLMSSNINAKLIHIIDSLITKIQNSKPDCNTFRNYLSTSSLTDEYTVCSNNLLLGENMSDNFVKVPIVLPENIAARNNDMVQYETNHVNLYTCDINVAKINKAIDQLNGLKNDLTELKVYIEEELNELKKGEFDLVKKEPGLSAWLGNKIGEFIEQLNSGGNLIDKQINFPFEPSLEYNSLASNNVFDYQGKSKYKSEDILKEISWLYQNDEEIINNVPRGFYSQALVNKMEAVNPPSIPNVLPLPFTIEKANNIYTIYIEKFVIEPTTSLIDVTAIFKDKKDGTTLAFGGINIPILSGGVTTATSKIYLKNDVSIKLLNTVKLNLSKGTNETYITWNCDGIQQFTLSGSVEFCNNYIIPLKNDLISVPSDSIYKLSFTTTFTDWLDFTVKVKGQPFYIKGLKKFPIEVDTLAFDFSKALSVSANVPIGYSHTFYDEKTKIFDPLWKGVSLHDLKIHLPRNLTGNSPYNHLAIGVDDAVFDDTGFSGAVYGERLIDIDTGSVAKWDFSIDGISVLFLHNNIAGGGIRGKIGVSFLKYPLDYDAILTKGSMFKLQVDVDSVNEAPAFFGKIILEKNTSININLDFESDTVSAVANLTGSIQIIADTGKLSKLLIPEITFQNFRIASYKPHFDPGKWGIKGMAAGSSFKPNLSLFGVSIDSIFPHKEGYDDEIYLGIAFKADLIDSFLSASGRIDVVGKMGYDGHGRQKWRYNRTRLGQLCIDATVKGSFSLSACVEFFEGNTIFGKGFRGAGIVKFGPIEAGLGIQAVCQFGTTNNNHKYFFVDVMYVSAAIAQIGPITLTGLGGGVSKGMYPQFQEGVFPQTNFDPHAYLTTPLGTTMSGVVYHPNQAWGWEFKLLTKFKLADEKMLSGFGEFIVRLNNKGALEEIELRATAVMFSDLKLDANELASSILPSNIDSLGLGKFSKPEQIEKPKDEISADAVVKGFISIKINFIKKEFHGQLALYMNGVGISGAGPNGALVMAEAYFSPQKWYVYIGKPTEGQRCGIKIDALGAIKARIETYLTAGTEVPGFPGLPNNVSHLAKDININESMRKSGLGFAFGSSFDVSINLDFYIAAANVNAGLGFDVMLKKYNDVGCLNGPAEIGANGWYAMGQMWVYVSGSISVVGINIIEAGAAAVLQAQFPNPTWVRGVVEIYVDTWLYEGKYSANFEIGHQCTFVTADPGNLLGIELISSINTENNSRIDQFFRPQATFAVDLSSSLKLDIGSGMSTFTFKLNSDSTKIFYGNEIGIIDATLKHDKFKFDNVIIIPLQSLPANDSIVLSIKVDIFKDGTFFASQIRKLKLFIGERELRIPAENVSYTYPVEGMYNFYKNENINHEGFIKLVSGQGYLFNDNTEYDFKAKFTKSGGGSFYTSNPITYNYAEKLIEFEIDPSNITNNSFYKIEIVAIKKPENPLELASSSENFNNTSNVSRSNQAVNLTIKETILYTIYFRTSNYNTFSEKVVDNINSTNYYENNYVPIFYEQLPVVIEEKFDIVELNSMISTSLHSAAVENAECDIFEFINKDNYPRKNGTINFREGFIYKQGGVILGLDLYLEKPIYSNKRVTEVEYSSRLENENNINQAWSTGIGRFINVNKDIGVNNLSLMQADFEENYGNGSALSYYGASLNLLHTIVYVRNEELWPNALEPSWLSMFYTLPNGVKSSYIPVVNFNVIPY